ncbi:uncharacterized protein TNCV_4285661 [Trichonephila clavipes]|nr:uncharacterized protein TNCV_4285661 [Trichonephila clavipes]
MAPTVALYAIHTQAVLSLWASVSARTIARCLAERQLLSLRSLRVLPWTPTHVSLVWCGVTLGGIGLQSSGIRSSSTTNPDSIWSGMTILYACEGSRGEYLGLGRWIGRDGPVNWPARSPDLFCLDFFLWSHMKSLVYTSPVDSDEALVARIAVVAGDIREMPGVFADVRQSLHRWFEACIFAGGCSFEQFL